MNIDWPTFRQRVIRALEALDQSEDGPRPLYRWLALLERVMVEG